jgi:hypothetical protein
VNIDPPIEVATGLVWGHINSQECRVLTITFEAEPTPLDVHLGPCRPRHYRHAARFLESGGFGVARGNDVSRLCASHFSGIPRHGIENDKGPGAAFSAR